MSKIPLTCAKVREGPPMRQTEPVSSVTYKRNQKMIPVPAFPNTKTKGEQFYEFLKSVGYEFPSKLRPEHLEYAFNDDKSLTAKLLKDLMKKVKKEHSLDPEELQSFEKLKSEGLALYGKDLEEAVDRRNMFEKRLTAEQENKSAKKEMLRNLIDQRKREISEIKSRTDVIDSMISATQKNIIKGQPILVRLQRESKDLDIEIQVSQKRLTDKADSLKEVKKILLCDDKAYSSHMKNAQSLVGINWENILKAEEDLNKEVRPLIQNHVADLIIRAEGYKDDKNSDQEADFLYRVLTKHADNFERLRHCIVYERARNAKLEIRLAGEQGAFIMLKPCLAQIRKAWRCGRDRNVFAQTQQELDDSIMALEEIYLREYQQAIESVKGGVLLDIDIQFATLSNVKAHAKKRLESFFFQVYRTLTPQKIRVDILRNVLKAEVNHYDNLVKRLQQHNLKTSFLNMETQFIAGDLNTNNLTEDGLAIQEFFSHQEIPVSLRSVPNTLDALLKMRHNIRDSKNSLAKKQNIEYRKVHNELSSQHFEITELYANLKNKYLSSNSKERQREEELEKIQLELEGKLKLWQENKPRLVDESIMEKKLLVRQIKESLAGNA